MGLITKSAGANFKSLNSASILPSVSLHEIPNDSCDVDLSLRMGIYVRPPVFKVTDARDKLVALETAGPYLARKTVPLLCIVHLCRVVSMSAAAHVILVLLNHVWLLLRVDMFVRSILRMIIFSFLIKQTFTYSDIHYQDLSDIIFNSP